MRTRPANAPLVVVPARDEHAVTTNAHAVKLVDDITVTGSPAGPAEETYPNWRMFAAAGKA